MAEETGIKSALPTFLLPLALFFPHALFIFSLSCDKRLRDAGGGTMTTRSCYAITNPHEPRAGGSRPQHQHWPKDTSPGTTPPRLVTARRSGFTSLVFEKSTHTGGLRLIPLQPLFTFLHFMSMGSCGGGATRL